MCSVHPEQQVQFYNMEREFEMCCECLVEEHNHILMDSGILTFSRLAKRDSTLVEAMGELERFIEHREEFRERYREEKRREREGMEEEIGERERELEELERRREEVERERERMVGRRREVQRE